MLWIITTFGCPFLFYGLEFLSYAKQAVSQYETIEDRYMGRVLALHTELLILDEPTSNLDEKSAEIISQIIAGLGKEKGIVIATHDKKLMMGKVIEL